MLVPCLLWNNDMKKIICALLAFSIIFLSACSAFPSRQAGLIEIQGLDEKTSSVLSVAFSKKHWVVLCNTYSQEENGTESFYNTINLINPKTATVEKSVRIPDYELEDFSDIKSDEDGNIIAYDSYLNRCIVYSSDLKQVSDVQKYSEEEYFPYRSNVFYDESFSDYESFAYDYQKYDENQRISGYLFNNDSNNIYITNKENFLPNSGYETRVLGSVINESEKAFKELRIYDFSSSQIINSIITPDYGADRIVSLGMSAIDKKSAFITIYDHYFDENTGPKGIITRHFYIWNYTLDKKNTSFDYRKISKKRLKKENKKLCRQIKRRYGVRVHLNEPNQQTLEGNEKYSLELDASQFRLFSVLIGIDCFFDMLPKGFIKQTYTSLENYNPKGLQIYIGNKIKGSISGYTEKKENYFEIALATDDFSIRTLAHEFMHIIDARLKDYYWEKDLNTLWHSLNRKGFEYLGDDEEKHNKIDFVEYEYDFVSRYAMTNEAEDRADTFEVLFIRSLNNETQTPLWFKEGKPAAKKAIFLCKAIRKAFPCMKNAPVQPWEEPIKNELNL